MEIYQKEMNSQQPQKEKEFELDRHRQRIQEFSLYCEQHNISVLKDDFDYIQTIGVVARRKNILKDIYPDLPVDKDGLVSWNFIKDKLQSSNQMAGYIGLNDFVVMVHPYFRRGMFLLNNWAPLFVELFWRVEDDNIDAYIALDFDNVRVNTESFFYMEADTWFGAPFDRNIENIPDGISKLRPPLDIERVLNNSIFNDAYSLDVKWSSKGNIRTFQALEFKHEDVTVELDGVTYHPVRYIHAEYDLNKKAFRHFDGAVQHFLPNEYHQRIDMDFNFDSKSLNSLKAKNIKLFKFNGEFSVNFWVEFCSHFYIGNPLIFEYFTGNYPDHVTDSLNRIREKVVT
ncbi:hypothetical protein VHA01S_023_00150 [Vibrio halioticoli NBRC 102217]|uniref:Uncharacterized protein n=2 Tax=Vibrio TaxID=662 RepID=V5FIE3_9VIBR|nr:hypothetical protein [Vibrio halioticoli]GAD89601.1 hypothetical protein VHA01S_023_00150 [Vibrio halioticoli NBRC 102217]